ncbi:hypothetical protein F1880_001881 [Penicillium rolfsii]|nr:hypothetical protein F1880_001881 [Penicillium rolfsii]
MAAKALPTHLRAPANEASAGSFGGKHHGKSQSHMVSRDCHVRNHRSGEEGPVIQNCCSSFSVVPAIAQRLREGSPAGSLLLFVTMGGNSARLPACLVAGRPPNLVAALTS